MDIEFDVNKLQKIVNDFYNTTGIGMYIYFSDDVTISSLQRNPYCCAIHKSAEGKKRCTECDNNYYGKLRNSYQTEIFVCHGGLVNVAHPLYFQSNYIGYMTLCGFREKDYDEIFEKISDLEFNKDTMKDFYQLLPLYDKTKFESTVSLAVILCEYILFSDAIKANLGENFKRAKAFIINNLDKDLSVEKIAKGANISKSVLYRLFAKNCNCTVSEYVNRKRVEHAAQMLVSTDYSISEITHRVGFNSTRYFYAVFKKKYNTTPMNYRKEHK